MESAEKVKLINTCRKLISIPSPSGHEGHLVLELKKIFNDLGPDEIFIDGYGSIIVRFKGQHNGPRILFDAHIDTVTVEDKEEWKHDPFGGEIDISRIYGRGASDMKGSLSAMIAAADGFMMEHGKNFNGDIYISGVVHEECFEGVGAKKISSGINPDYVVIGEASELNLKCGQRGRAEIAVEVYGKCAHSANPEKGVNAVHKMMKLIAGIEKLDCPKHDILGKGILTLTDIISAPYPGASVVPNCCSVTYDRRLLTGESRDDVLKPIIKLIEEMKKTDEDFNASVYFRKASEQCYTGNVIEGERFFPAWLVDKDDDFVQKILNGLRQIGLKSEITQYSFCTNGSYYAGEAGIKTIGFGPSCENLAHIRDEYIEIKQLELACEGYKKIMELVLCS